MERRSSFHNELKDIFNEVVSMGKMVTEQLQRGLECLINADKDLASVVISHDSKVDAFEIAIEDRCVLVLAKEAPVATELREVLTVMKIVSELERLGDHAKHLALKTGKIDNTGLKNAAPLLRDMMDLGCQMVREALEAFLELDSTWAKEIASRDKYIDERYVELYNILVDLIKDKPDNTEKIVPLFILNRHLERIGDRVTNICECVIYSKTNKHTELG